MDVAHEYIKALCGKAEANASDGMANKLVEDRLLG